MADATLFESVLLVEDEPNLASALEIALKRLGLGARRTSTLAEARSEIERRSPELILLDRDLPDGDGIDLCAELRKRRFPGMILMLTAAGRPADRVRGLEAGADDYLPKPFSWEELTARIRALARRKSPTPGPPVSPPWSLDPARLRVLGPGGWVELTPLEYKLASHLIEAGGEIVSRQALLRKVWGFSLLPQTRTVDHFVGRLRKHFEARPDEPRHFLTVRGAGYRFRE